MGDEVGEVNSTNIPSIAASSARHDASIFTAAQNLNFTIANSQFVDVHGNYSVVCDHCAGVNVHIMIMTTLSKSTTLCYDKHALRAEAPIPRMFFSPLVL